MQPSTLPCESVPSPRIETVATLSSGRYSPAAAVLDDGRALIAGGFDFVEGAQASAEIFEGTSNRLVPTGTLRDGRNFIATSRLADGSQLLIGGFDPNVGSLAVADRYDPGTGTFRRLTRFLSAGREAHTATALPGGAVLVAGGLQARGFRFHATAEIYDPATESFSATAAPMSTARAFHAAVFLESRNEVLIAGGDSGRGELATAERYDVSARRFVGTAGARARRGKAVAAALLPDGRVLVTGGANGIDGTLADADAFDPVSDSFAVLEPMATRRMAHTLTRLTDGRILALGGWSDSTSPSASTAVLDLYDPVRARWETLAIRLSQPRHDHVALLLPDCRVLIAGGQQVTAGSAPRAPREVEIVTVPLRR